MNRKPRALQVAERVVSMLIAAGLGYIALMHVEEALMIAWGIVCAGAAAKLVLLGIVCKAKPAT